MVMSAVKFTQILQQSPVTMTFLAVLQLKDMEKLGALQDTVGVPMYQM